MNLLLAIVVSLLLASAPGLAGTAYAAAADSARDSGIKVQLNAENVGPREIEDTTEAAIVRDYSTAWKVLETALADNRTDLLDSGFVGFERDRLAARVGDQKKIGLRTRYVDHGHKVQAIFYSPEGSTMQLRDVAQLELQVLDGDTVISTRNVTRTIIAIMTVTEERWKVRVLQETE